MEEGNIPRSHLNSNDDYDEDINQRQTKSLVNDSHVQQR